MPIYGEGMRESGVFELNGIQVAARFGYLPDGSFMFDFGREETFSLWDEDEPRIWFGNCLRLIHRYDGGYMDQFECSYVESSPPDGLLIHLDSRHPEDAEGLDVDATVGRVIDHFRNPPLEPLQFEPPLEIDLLNEDFVCHDLQRVEILSYFCLQLTSVCSLTNSSDEDRFFYALYGACRLVGWEVDLVVQPSGLLAGRPRALLPEWLINS